MRAFWRWVKAWALLPLLIQDVRDLLRRLEAAGITEPKRLDCGHVTAGGFAKDARTGQTLCLPCHQQSMLTPWGSAKWRES